MSSDCPWPGKQAYPTFAAAARALDAMRSAGGWNRGRRRRTFRLTAPRENAGKMKPYRCPGGRHWHLGHHHY